MTDVYAKPKKAATWEILKGGMRGAVGILLFVCINERICFTPLYFLAIAGAFTITGLYELLTGGALPQWVSLPPLIRRKIEKTSPLLQMRSCGAIQLIGILLYAAIYLSP